MCACVCVNVSILFSSYFMCALCMYLYKCVHSIFVLCMKGEGGCVFIPTYFNHTKDCCVVAVAVVAAVVLINEEPV